MSSHSSIDDEFGEFSVLRLQLIELALLNDSSFFEDNVVAAHASSVVGSLGEVNGSHFLHGVLQALLNRGFLLRLIFHAQGNVVDQQNLGLEHDSPCNLESLFLIDRQLASIGAQSLVVALRELRLSLLIISLVPQAVLALENTFEQLILCHFLEDQNLFVVSILSNFGNDGVLVLFHSLLERLGREVILVELALIDKVLCISNLNCLGNLLVAGCAISVENVFQ